MIFDQPQSHYPAEHTWYWELVWICCHIPSSGNRTNSGKKLAENGKKRKKSQNSTDFDWRAEQTAGAVRNAAEWRQQVKTQSAQKLEWFGIAAAAVATAPTLACRTLANGARMMPLTASLWWDWRKRRPQLGFHVEVAHCLWPTSFSLRDGWEVEQCRVESGLCGGGEQSKRKGGKKEEKKEQVRGEDFTN